MTMRPPRDDDATPQPRTAPPSHIRPIAIAERGRVSVGGEHAVGRRGERGEERGQRDGGGGARKGVERDRVGARGRRDERREGGCMCVCERE
eukprot:2555775-Rhodomonas_salina.1